MINKLKCEKRNFTKNTYANSSSLSFDIKKLFNKENEKDQIKIINIIHCMNKELIFMTKNNELLIYQLNQNPYLLIKIKSISNNYFFDNDIIKYFHCFKYENKIIFNFFSLKEIKLYLFNIDTFEFILKRKKKYCDDNNNKYFYFMKKTKQYIIFKYNEVVIYDQIFSKSFTLLEIDDDMDKEIDMIKSCKELSDNLLCINFNRSIELYDLNLEKDKLIGSISDIYPQSVKLIEIKKIKYLMILSEGDIIIYDLKDLNLIKKLELNGIKYIKKIKQLPNSDLGIIYGDNNFAVFDLNNNFIKYKIKNENNINFFYKQYFFLKNIDKNTILYNPSRYGINIINYIKGQTLSKFSDGHNRIFRCRKIHCINKNEVNNEENIKFYLLGNIKGYFLLIIKK